MSAFAQPSTPAMGDKFEAHEHKGHLILVYPKLFQENVKTTKGLSDAADVDIIVVDKLGPDGRPLFFSGARLFGNLARSVRNDIGGQVLGRLDQITSANGNTPWILNSYTDQDAALAGTPHQQYQAGHFKPPAANPMAPPAAPAPTQQWPQQAPAPAAPPAAPQQQWTPAPQAAPAPVPPAPPIAQAPAAQWNAPAPSPAAPPAAPTPSPAPAVDPNLVAFLGARGVQVTPQMDQATCEAIARSFNQ